MKSVYQKQGVYSVYGVNNVMNFYPFTTENVNTEFKGAEVYIKGAKKQTEDAFIQDYTGTVWQNAVAFSWAPKEDTLTKVLYKVGENANEHLFEVNGKIYTLNVAENTLQVAEGSLNLPNPWASDSSLSDILFDGTALENFDSATTEYTLERHWKTKELNLIPIASAEGTEVTMDWNGECPGTVTITCTSEDKSSTTVYTLKLKNDSGMLGIQSASTTQNDLSRDITHTYDNFVAPDDATKTWASRQLPVVTYDMGRLVDISKIDVAFNVSRDRGSYYDLLVSENGENWKTLKEGAKSDRTATDGPFNDYQTIYSGELQRAQYVRIALRGNDGGANNPIDNAAAYCSIQEISIYGVEVKPSVMNPEIVTEATDTSYTLGSDTTVTIKSTGDYNKFECVKMDGIIVDEANYTVAEGSTIVTFKAEYLKTLSAGEHSVTIHYTDGSNVESKLAVLADTSDSSDSSIDDNESSDSNTDNSESSDSSIEDNNSSKDDADDDSNDADNNEGDSNAVASEADITEASGSNTSDSSNMTLWIMLMVVCMFGVVVMFVIKKKKD